MTSPNDQAGLAPQEQIQHVQIMGIPPLWQMIVTLVGVAAVIIGSLGTAGAWYLKTSLEATESKISETLTKSLGPVNQRQAEFKMIVSLLVSKSTELTPEEKQSYSNLLSKITYEDVKSLLQQQPAHAEKRSLNQLIQDKEVEQVGKTARLVWDGDKPAQVRYIKLNNPALDLSRIDLYSDSDSSPCRSKVLQSLEPSNATVQVCEAHLDSDRRLELIIIKNPPSSSTP
ncbi:MAG: hypothetical protein ACJ74W_24545 [Pyrinomonadaceae bacterium]